MMYGNCLQKEISKIYLRPRLWIKEKKKSLFSGGSKTKINDKFNLCIFVFKRLTGMSARLEQFRISPAPEVTSLIVPDTAGGVLEKI
jgi:hypothetical protein